LDLPEATCTEPEGDLHQSVLGPVNLEGEAGGSEFDKPEPEVAGVAVGIVGLEIADAGVFILELPLKQDVGSGDTSYNEHLMLVGRVAGLKCGRKRFGGDPQRGQPPRTDAENDLSSDT
jgi:hypothetical protein